MKNIEKQCKACLRIARKEDSINPSLRTSCQSFYNANKDKTGFEKGCNPSCPFLLRSINVLG